MNPLMQFLLILSIIIVVAKAAGFLSSRLGQPAVLGELLAGLILGPTALNMLGWGIFTDAHLGEFVRHLAEVGVLFLMFLAGQEVDVEAMARSGRAATLAGVLGVVAPVGMGLAAAIPFGYDAREALSIGLVLAATSVSISAQTLMELKVLRTRVGVALLAAAVVDDVLVILAFSIFIALAVGGGGGAVAVVWVLVRMLAFLGLAYAVGIALVPRLSVTIDRLPISEGVIALAIVVVLLYAWAAEVLGGIAAITGAFVAGLVFARSPVHEHIEERMRSLAYAWLVPVFFVSIGLSANARELGVGGIPFAVVLIVVAIVSKVIGCGLGAHFGGFSGRDAFRLGIGMSSRGEVGLIVAAVGMEAGLIGDAVFAGVVIMVLATTLLTPIMLRALYPRPQEAPQRIKAHHW